MYKDYSKVIKTITKTNTVNEEAFAINNSIKNILTTLIGTLPGKPEFGCNIANYTFEQLDYITEHIIRDDILRALIKFEPRINVVNIELKSVPEYNKYIIDITYKYKVKNIKKTTNTSISIV